MHTMPRVIRRTVVIERRSTASSREPRSPIRMHVVMPVRVRPACC